MQWHMCVHLLTTMCLLALAVGHGVVWRAGDAPLKVADLQWYQSSN